MINSSFKKLNLTKAKSSYLRFCKVKNLLVKNKTRLKYSQIDNLNSNIKFSSSEKLKYPYEKVLIPVGSSIKKIKNEKTLRKIAFCKNCSNFEENENKLTCSLDNCSHNCELIFKQIEYNSKCPFLLEALILD